VLSHGERREQYDAMIAEGRLRWTADDDARPKRKRPEDQITDAAAKKFYLLGMEALRTGNTSSAVMNLQFAQQRDPNNPVIRDAFEQAKTSKS
jgi:outer membrane protein assembly factor BamD (BamD/ComL family)